MQSTRFSYLNNLIQEKLNAVLLIQKHNGNLFNNVFMLVSSKVMLKQDLPRLACPDKKKKLTKQTKIFIFD